MVDKAGFYGAVYDTAKSLGANDTQAALAASQASQETGYGQHVVGNNYFGIKSSAGMPTVNASTNEVVNGQNTSTNADFNAYNGFVDSVKGYMQTMARSFPDAWNAPDFTSAAQALTKGVFGSYATDPNYVSKVSNINQKYGQYAGLVPDISSVPTPYSPIDPQNLPEQATAADGLAGVINPAIPIPVQRADLAAPTGLLSSYQSMALADPISAPYDVNAVSGTMSPAMAAASTAPVGLLSMPATASLGVTPGLDASATTGSIGQNFDMSRLGPAGLLSVDPSAQAITNPAMAANTSVGSVGMNFDQSRFGVPAESVSAQPGMTFSEAMRTPANLGAQVQAGLDSLTRQAVQAPMYTQSFNTSLPSMQTAGALPNVDMTPASPITAAQDYAASQAPTTGIYSPLQKSLDASAASQLAGMVPQSNFQIMAAAPPVSTGLLSAPAQSATISGPATTQTGLLSGYQSLPTATAAEQAISAAAAPAISQNIANAYGQLANTATQAGVLGLDGTKTMSLAGNLNAVNPALASIPAMTPTSTATIAGPTTTSAVDQQQQAASTAQAPQNSFPANPALSSFPAAPKTGLLSGLSGLVNKDAVAGGLLGGVIAGPLGAGLGGLLGYGLSKATLGGQPFSINNIGGGLTNVASVYGGAPPGTTAQTNNGGSVTSLGGGNTAYTNKYGVTTVTSPTGEQSSYFGSKVPGVTPGSNPGGYSSPGLF